MKRSPLTAESESLSGLKLTQMRTLENIITSKFTLFHNNAHNEQLSVQSSQVIKFPTGVILHLNNFKQTLNHHILCRITNL